MKETRIKSVYCRLMTKNDPETIKLAKRLGMDQEEIEDLIEEQRPNILNYDDYSIITLIFPTIKTIKTNEFMLQITFIITRKGINIIINEENEHVTKAFNELSKKEIEGGITGILSEIIDSVREDSIETFDKFEDYLNKKEKEIVQGKKDKKLMIKMHNIKETLYYVLKTLQGNITVINELINNKVKLINPKHFSEHQEDRALYFEDLIEYLRESVKTNIETYTSLLSHQLNERIYKLTIIGSILLIPAMISGLFGMNVTLPTIGFWELIGISAIISFITYWLIK